MMSERELISSVGKNGMQKNVKILRVTIGLVKTTCKVRCKDKVPILRNERNVKLSLTHIGRSLEDISL